MKRLSSIFISILFFCLTAMGVFPASSTCGENGPPTLYIYLAGPAQVEEERIIGPDKTGAGMQFTDLSASLIPQSFLLTEISENKSPNILARRFRFDLADKDTLMKALAGRAVEISEGAGTVSGKMYTFPGGYICAGESAYYIYLDDRTITVKNPGSLYLTPTLILKIDPAPEVPTKMRLSYQVGGLNWIPSYSLIINPDELSAILNFYSSLQNLKSFGFDRANVIFMGKAGKASPKIESAASESSDTSQSAPSNESPPDTVPVTENIHQSETLLQSVSGSLARRFSFEGDAEFFSSGEAQLSQTTTAIPCTAEFIAKPPGDGSTEFPPGELSVFNQSSQLQFRGKINPDNLPNGVRIFFPLESSEGLELLRSRIKSESYTTGETEIAVSYQVKNQKDFPAEMEIMENFPFDWELAEFSHDYEISPDGKLKFFIKIPPLNMVLIEYRLRIINNKEGETLGGY